MKVQPLVVSEFFSVVVSPDVPPMSITSLMNVVARAGNAAVSANVAAVSAMAGSMGNVLRKDFALIPFPFTGWAKASVSVLAVLVTRKQLLDRNRSL